LLIANEGRVADHGIDLAMVVANGLKEIRLDQILGRQADRGQGPTAGRMSERVQLDPKDRGGGIAAQEGGPPASRVQENSPP
jgi:hypothetical protein